MRSRFVRLFVAAVAGASSLQTPAAAQEPLSIDGFCQYDGDRLPDDLYGFESDGEAQAAVKRVLDHTGLVQNFTIKAANVPNAAAVIQGQQRSILYNQDFMRRVRSTANTDWAAISIMAHEVGHHLQGHTIQAGGSRPSIELEADRYSGYVLYRMGATLAQAKIAMEQLGSESGSNTHPPRSARLAAITNGWSAAEELGKSSATPGPARSNPQPQGPDTPGSSGPPGPTPAPGPAQPSPTYVSRVVFSGDPVAYFVTATDDLVGVRPGSPPVIVGRKIPPTLPGFAWMYATAQVVYAVSPDGRVWTRNNFGVPSQIGYVTNP